MDGVTSGGDGLVSDAAPDPGMDAPPTRSDLRRIELLLARLIAVVEEGRAGISMANERPERLTMGKKSS